MTTGSANKAVRNAKEFVLADHPKAHVVEDLTYSGRRVYTVIDGTRYRGVPLSGRHKSEGQAWLVARLAVYKRRLLGFFVPGESRHRRRKYSTTTWGACGAVWVWKTKEGWFASYSDASCPHDKTSATSGPWSSQSLAELELCEFLNSIKTGERRE